MTADRYQVLDDLAGPQRDELLEWLEALCEDRLDAETAKRLEAVVLAEPAAMSLYLEYVSLHGTLYWDTACGMETDQAVESTPAVTGSGTSRRWAVVVTAAAALLLTVGLTWWPIEQGGPPGIAGVDPAGPTEPVAVGVETDGRIPRRPVTISADPATPLANKRGSGDDASRVVTPGPESPIQGSSGASSRSGSLADVVAFVDGRLQAGWSENEVTPSDVASDSEWLRRVHLDLVGHIPSAQRVMAFLQDRSLQKRARMIDELLDDPDYVRHSTRVWSNLLVGRMERREVNRQMLDRFLRDGFARNRPWNELVSDLVSAEGRNDKNGATNFLLAHLNNDAAPATAITSRLFLGTQVQCTQCHNHPFNEWRQDAFHGMTAFFEGTRSRRVPGSDAFELASTPVDGQVHFEDRQGVMHMARAGLGERRAELKGHENPRAVLAQLMSRGEDLQLARAMVNRTWSRLLGRAFTLQVDDMGPHSPPSHPALLDRLAREFVASGYDVKQLIRWIANSRVYGLSSRIAEGNREDDPESGTAPMFSRVYSKPMSVEQLYDSLLVATQVDHVAASDWESVSSNRRNWKTQFVHSYETDENDEAVNFDGTITQAMMMMNGPLIRAALSEQPGSYLHHVLHHRGSDLDRVKRLCLSALGRFPSSAEMKAIAELLPLRSPTKARQSPASGPLAEGLQDVFWAYLNSNEFITVP